jgi:16S rRNA (cytidine1402-2'-O)-methyltransferase
MNSELNESNETKRLAPGLYLLGTPIGNLGDITLRAIETLRQVDVVMAEDTRHSRKLLNHLDIHKRMLSCHKFNEAARFEHLRRLIADQGLAVAMITDSGMPCISDPGSRSVAACRENGLHVTVIPGPSAVASAAALSGLVKKGYRFEGFLSPKGAARRKRLGALCESDVPVVIFESPYRLIKLLTDIDAVMGDRPVFLGRELTKHFEESLSGTAAEIAALFDGRKVKGECVLVIGAKS